MPIFQITTTRTRWINGCCIEPGMTVQVTTRSTCNPVTTNGGQIVVDAFMRIYGVDIRKAGCLNVIDLKVERVG